jgi:hypothetical protein
MSSGTLWISIELNHLQKPCQMKNLDALRIPKKKEFWKTDIKKKMLLDVEVSRGCTVDSCLWPTRTLGHWMYTWLSPLWASGERNASSDLSSFCQENRPTNNGQSSANQLKEVSTINSGSSHFLWLWYNRTRVSVPWAHQIAGYCNFNILNPHFFKYPK